MAAEPFLALEADGPLSAHERRLASRRRRSKTDMRGGGLACRLVSAVGGKKT